MEFTDSDATGKVITLQLPSPHVVSRRIDREATRVHRVDRFGLRHLAFGEAGARQVVQQALTESEKVVHKTNQELSHLTRPASVPM